MNNLLVHRSHPRPQKGLTTISPVIIDDKEQTPMCGSWPWRIPKLRIAPAVRSLFFRLRGRTPVTMLKPGTSDIDSDVSYGLRSRTRLGNKVEPLTPIAFSTNNSKCLQPSISNKYSPVASSPSVRDVSTPTRFSLPSTVVESEVFETLRSDILQPSVSDSDKSGISGEAEAKTILFHGPEYNFQPNSDHLIYQQVGKSLDNDKAALGAALETNFKYSKTDNESTPNADDDRDIIQGESVDTSSKEEVQHSVDILVITHSPSPSPRSDTNSDVKINIEDDEQDFNGDEVSETRMGKECWGEQEPEKQSIVEGYLAKKQCAGIPSSVDFSKPDDAEIDEMHWVKGEDTTMQNYPELEEELNYYEDNDEAGDDYLDMDKVLKRCPPTEVLQNLRDMVQLSKHTTSQLEKALRRAARISCGPFPRLPGTGLTKTEVVDLKCTKLVDETEDFLGDMNKNFLTFYTVLEQMDKVSVQQDSFVSSILVKRGPRDWRRGHAAILRKMDKLWSRDYPKVITRKLRGSIQETIYEEDEK